MPCRPTGATMPNSARCARDLIDHRGLLANERPMRPSTPVIASIAARIISTAKTRAGKPRWSATSRTAASRVSTPNEFCGNALCVGLIL